MASVYAIARRCEMSIADTIHTTPGVLLDMFELLHPHKREFDIGEEE